MPSILVVDDEKNIVKGIKFSLEQDGMQVDAAYDGEEALQLAREKKYDVIILDVMLPKLEGTEVCQQIREFSAVPVVMVTAKDDDMDKIMGLEYGADDYITKPFNILELKARIKAILRRTTLSKPVARKAEKLVLRDINVDTQARRVFVREKEINLTAREYDLLEFFMNNIGRVFEREELLTRIWGAENTGDVRTVDVHVRRLREKIEESPSDPKYINTKWGVGYYFR
ncbi:MAG: response regulator transcription factor [Defluviitaleaceae bacterium]|nr:response regulator transcription factor [Defluviitaleaceae bacterium]MCL2238628.1 response regulator transcription factor [Defluviitaleaceae bacterium]